MLKDFGGDTEIGELNLIYNLPRCLCPHKQLHSGAKISVGTPK